MIRITYEQGNGYGCTCCRQTYSEHEDFDKVEDAQQWIDELEACKTESCSEDDDDREIIDIREVKKESISMFPDAENVKKIIKQRKDAKAKKKKKDDKKNAKKREEQERKKLAELKEKYEND